ncbi:MULTISPECIES: hypothetical protein [unclassified Burkholderia]|uniref:hypothetical protein n=1 Tax=unclassified Burkholderia TaxID=2613784 RepID=UPI002AB21BF0|nr:MULTISPECIES: hypothetical protein [unclassified Burkholderia]
MNSKLTGYRALIEQREALDAVADAMIAWQDAMGSEGKLGMQSRAGEHIPFKD